MKEQSSHLLAGFEFALSTLGTLFRLSISRATYVRILHSSHVLLLPSTTPTQADTRCSIDFNPMILAGDQSGCVTGLQPLIQKEKEWKLSLSPASKVMGHTDQDWTVQDVKTVKLNDLNGLPSLYTLVTTAKSPILHYLSGNAKVFAVNFASPISAVRSANAIIVEWAMLTCVKFLTSCPSLTFCLIDHMAQFCPGYFGHSSKDGPLQIAVACDNGDILLVTNFESKFWCKSDHVISHVAAFQPGVTVKGSAEAVTKHVLVAAGQYNGLLFFDGREPFYHPTEDWVSLLQVSRLERGGTMLTKESIAIGMVNNCIEVLDVDVK